MSPTLTTFLFEAGNFLVLVAVLGWLFFKPVREAIQRRQVAVKTESDEAAQKLADVGRQQSEIERRLADLNHELDEHRTRSHAAAKQQADNLLAQARQNASQETEAAKHRLAHLESGQREHLAHVIAQAAAATVDRLLRRIEQPALDHALVAAACREIGNLDRSSLSPVRIESARPLDPDDRTALLTALGPVGDSAEFRVTERLGIGVRVTTNGGLIDVSAAGLSIFTENLLARLLTVDNSTETAANV